MSTDPGAAPGWRRAGEGRFGPVLALLIATLIVGAVLPTRLSALAVAGVGVVLWIAAARAARLSPALLRTGLATLVVVLAVAALAAATDSANLQGVADLALAGVVAGLVVAIARALVRERVVTLSTVAGVLSLYLLFGLFFAQVYIGVDHLHGEAFTAAGALGRFDLVYFSFIALTTVGFGDITPALDLTKAFAATEAVLGQLFLVTVVARAVSLLGKAPGS